jgi:minor extracellular serine protease Vpr
VTLTVPASTAGSSSGGLAFREAVGLIELTPASASDNAGVKLRVPYYMVPRSLSNVDTELGSTSKKGLPEGTPVTTTATVTNAGGARAGRADFYAWGLSDDDEASTSPSDIRAVGVQNFAASDVIGAAAQPGERFLAFAVNTHHRWSTGAVTEFDIALDVDRDKKADYIVVGVDQGAVQTGTFNGRMGAFVFSTRSAGASIVFLASDPTNSSTVLLPILGRQLCRAGEPCLAADKPFFYSAVGFDLLDGGADPVGGTAEYDAFNTVVGEGGFASVNPGATASVPVSINVDRFNRLKPLGLMVVSFDNAAGAGEAELLPISLK